MSLTTRYINTYDVRVDCKHGSKVYGVTVSGGTPLGSHAEAIRQHQNEIGRLCAEATAEIVEDDRA